MATVTTLTTQNGFPIHYPGGTASFSMSSLGQPRVDGTPPQIPPSMPMPSIPQYTGGPQAPPTSAFPQAPLKQRNDVDLDRSRLIAVLTHLSLLLTSAFEHRPIRLVVHGGACMLLHPMLHELSLQWLQRQQQQQSTQYPYQLSNQQNQQQLPSLPSRRTTRDVDYLHRAFVQEMMQLGVRHAPEKFAACLAETARRFGLGADWMNGDADIALPMATAPNGTTYDPIFMAAIQPNNVDLHTVFKSPNGMLTLVSVTPFWAVSLKLVRYTPADAADICLLLRNGTLLSGTNWSVDTLREWLFANCWPMGYANYDAKRLQLLTTRLNHAVLVVTEWGISNPQVKVTGSSANANSNPINHNNPLTTHSNLSYPANLSHLFPDSATAPATWASVNVPFTPNVKFDPLIAMGGKHSTRADEEWKSSPWNVGQRLGPASANNSHHTTPDHGAKGLIPHMRDGGVDEEYEHGDEHGLRYGADFSVSTTERAREGKKTRRRRRHMSLALALEDRTNAVGDEKATEPEHWHPRTAITNQTETRTEPARDMMNWSDGSKENIQGKAREHSTSMDMSELRRGVSEILSRDRANLGQISYGRGSPLVNPPYQHGQGQPYPGPGGPPYQHNQEGQLYPPYSYQHNAPPVNMPVPVIPDLEAYKKDKEKEKEKKKKDKEKRKKEKEREKERRRERFDKLGHTSTGGQELVGLPGIGFPTATSWREKEEPDSEVEGDTDRDYDEARRLVGGPRDGWSVAPPGPTPTAVMPWNGTASWRPPASAPIQGPTQVPDMYRSAENLGRDRRRSILDISPTPRPVGLPPSVMDPTVGARARARAEAEARDRQRRTEGNEDDEDEDGEPFIPPELYSHGSHGQRRGGDQADWNVRHYPQQPQQQQLQLQQPAYGQHSQQISTQYYQQPPQPSARITSSYYGRPY